MLGLNSSISAAIPKSITRNIPYSNPIRPFLLKSRKPQTRLLTLANNGDDPVTTEPANSSLFDDKNDGGGDRRPLFDIKWADLLNPDADNVLAVGLTGLLTWASVQVLWQLLFISLAILVAAVKYSFIAALLLFILITLL
ncbi:unnamed protein product [Rhodiola kirilowii]